MIKQDSFFRFGASFLIGTLIGIQREYSHCTVNSRTSFAGARTFALMALFGSSAALLVIDPGFVILL
jgi:uncharacterized membrane protein YhiD involved in acid resistance